MSAVVMSAAAVQQLGDVLQADAGAIPAATRTLRRRWNNRKCGASERRFPPAKEYLLKPLNTELNPICQ